ncbi:MAG: GNAT family N-acetyltransferase [Acidimicrobiales bacterium]
MTVRIEEEPITGLDEHATISIAFRVERILEVSLPDAGLGGIRLDEVAVDRPWVKDYDESEGEGPTRWVERFDTSHWGLIAAHDGEARIGGAVIAFDTPGVNVLEGRSDLAVLWDIRVRPESRSAGVGAALFAAVEEWSRSRGCQTLKIETQNINLAACRFYARMGCQIGALNRRAYLNLPDETEVLWVKDLQPIYAG